MTMKPSIIIKKIRAPKVPILPLKTMIIPGGIPESVIENVASNAVEVDNPSKSVSKNIYVLVDHSLSEDETWFLNKIMSSRNLLPAAFEIRVIDSGLKLAIKNLEGKVLYFGTQIDIPTVTYYVPIQGKTALLLCAHGLSDLNADSKLKKNLWDQLKNLF